MLHATRRFLPVALCCALIAAILSPSPAAGQCEPKWSAAFGGPHPNGPVRALLRHDDGSGLSLFAGGDFTAIGDSGAVHIARWDGHAWWRLGTGLNGPVHAMAILDEDGPGPAAPVLIVGGDFTVAGGVPAHGLARWDGWSWSPVGSGFAGSVRALHVAQSSAPGAAPVLYVGGEGLTLNAAPAGTVAQWSAGSWSSLGEPLGPNGRVLALAWHADSLFAGGEAIDSEGPDLPHHVAHLQSSEWSAVPETFTNGGARARVAAMASHASTLYVGGDFLSVSSSVARGAARYTNGLWIGIIPPVDLSVRDITVREHPQFPAIRFCGQITAGSLAPGGAVESYNPSSGPSGSWTSLRFFDGAVLAVADVDPATGSSFAGGEFQRRGAHKTPFIYAHNTPSPNLANGVSTLVFGVSPVDIPDDAGNSLVIHTSVPPGNYESPGVVARWNGARWSRVPLPAHALDLRAAAAFDPDGAGVPSLILAKEWSGTSYFYRWNGSELSFLNVLPGRVHRMTVMDDGTGPALYVAGEGVSTALWKWDGQTWTAVGGRVRHTVRGLQYVAPPGSGLLAPGLYVGGVFDEAGPFGEAVAAGNIARWDGAQWTPLGSGLGVMGFAGGVHDLALFNDGSEPQLYAAGSITSAGGQPVSGIARWNGAEWGAVGAGLTSAAPYIASGRALAVFDDGSGPALYVAGSFDAAGGVPVRNLARWDGQMWSPVGAGPNAAVNGLIVFDEDGDGPRPPALYAVGDFSEAGGTLSYNIARWGRPVPIVRRDPRDVTVHSAGVARLHGDAPGGANGAGGTLHHQWRRNGVPLADGGAVSGSDTPYLIINPARHPHAGQYSLTVTNDCGQTTTASATLTILCPADWDGNGAVTSADITAFVADWLTAITTGTLDADFDHGNQVDSRDLSAFIAEWLAAVQNGGC